MEKGINFQEMLKEYNEAMKQINTEELTKKNKVLSSDILDKDKQIKNVSERIEQQKQDLAHFQKAMEGLRDMGEFDNEMQMQIQKRNEAINEATSYREILLTKKQKIDEERQKNEEKINKAKNAGKEIIKKAEDKTQKQNDELNKQINTLKKEKELYGVKTQDKDGNPIKRITPEEQKVIDGIEEKTTKIKSQIKNNNKKLQIFKDQIIRLQKAHYSESKDNTTPEEAKPKETKSEPKVTEEIEPVEAEPEEPKLTEPEEPKPEEPKPEEPKPEEPKQKEPKKTTGEKVENNYEKELLGYKELLAMYNQELEKLYDLQSKFENGEIEYSVYEKQAEYMVERYRFIIKEYQKTIDKYGKEVKEIGESKSKKWHPELTQDQIEELMAEGIEPGDNEYNLALWNYGINPSTQPKEEENEYAGLTDEQLKEELERLNREFEEEYHFRAHEENGLEEHNDDNDILDKIRKIKEELDRRKKVVKKPEQPMIVLNKGKSPVIPEPIPKPITKLPIRSFWEIYNSTCTEHAGTISTVLYKAAKMKILPKKDTDTATKILSAPLIPLKMLIKAGATIPNAIMGTTKKMKEMQKAIDGLSAEEFEILVTSPEKMQELFGTDELKDSFDRDYLEPQFMKQYKVNELYLRAVESRLSRERNAAIEYFNSEIKGCDKKIKQLEKIKEKRELTADEQIEYNTATQTRGDYIFEGKKCREEIDLFNDGIKKKSNGFKNISGWFLGKFNPDNREQNQRMAALSRKRREEAAVGNQSQVSSISNEMQRFSSDQTRIYGKRNDTIDRGTYSIEGPIEMLDKGEENRGRLLLTDIALGAAVVDCMSQFRRIAENKIAIDNHNKEVVNANRDNSDIQVSGTIQGQSVDDARAAAARVVTDGKFGRNERANLGQNGWDTSSSGYKAGDVITHTEAARAANGVKTAVSRGDTIEAWKTAESYARNGAQVETDAMLKFAKDNPQFDYTAVDATYGSDIEMLGRFLSNPSFNTTVSGTMISTLQGIRQGVSPLALIFAGANALHQGAKQGTRDGLKKSLKATAITKEKNKGTINKDGAEER